MGILWVHRYTSTVHIEIPMPVPPAFTRTAAWLALAAMTLLPACAANRFGPIDRITIDSEPQGAQVLVADKPVGVTPLAVVLDDVFPMRWTARTDKDTEGFAFYRRLDTLTIKKEGCDPYIAQVDSTDLARDIKINLKCDPNYKPPVAVEPANPAPVQRSTADNLEQRLQQLESLKQKGLITNDEYRVQRQRILGGI